MRLFLKGATVASLPMPMPMPLARQGKGLRSKKDYGR